MHCMNNGQKYFPDSHVAHQGVLVMFFNMSLVRWMVHASSEEIHLWFKAQNLVPNLHFACSCIVVESHCRIVSLTL